MHTKCLQPSPDVCTGECQFMGTSLGPLNSPSQWPCLSIECHFARFPAILLWLCFARPDLLWRHESNKLGVFSERAEVILKGERSCLSACMATQSHPEFSEDGGACLTTRNPGPSGLPRHSTRLTWVRETPADAQQALCGSRSRSTVAGQVPELAVAQATENVDGLAR